MFTTYYNSPAGLIEIKGSEEAIHSVLFIDTPQEANDEAPAPQLLEDCKNQLQQYFEGKLQEFKLPLHQEGTPFQQQVWNELLTIRYGNISSYISIARKIDNEKSVRAVGSANGQNNIAIIVPCHRVIGSNGKLTGYAGGLWRKQWLLDHEAKIAHGVQKLFQ